MPTLRQGGGWSQRERGPGYAPYLQTPGSDRQSAGDVVGGGWGESERNEPAETGGEEEKSACAVCIWSGVAMRVYRRTEEGEAQRPRVCSCGVERPAMAPLVQAPMRTLWGLSSSHSGSPAVRTNCLKEARKKLYDIGAARPGDD